MTRLAGYSVAAVVLLLFAQCPSGAQQRESEAQRVSDSTGETEHDSQEILWASVNFVLLVVGLGYLIKKHAGPYFAQRSVEIRKGLADAEAERTASDAKVAEVDRRLANLGNEIDALRRNAQQEAEAEAQRARREAEAEMAKVKAHIGEEIASASKSATLELRRYSAELALALAEQKIAARLSPEIQDRLVGNFAATMAHAASGMHNN
jgi:F-type H+-transporting ATPase subunit b